MSFDYSYYRPNRYSRWDGTQKIEGLSADDIMEAISDDMFADGDLQRALQRLFRWGMDKQDGTKMPGIRQMMERLKAMRQRELSRYDIGSVLEDLKQRLEEIQSLEREGIEQRLEQGRQRLNQPEAPTEQQASEAGEQAQGLSLIHI